MPSKKGKVTASTRSISLNIKGEVCFDKLKVVGKCKSFYTVVASKLVEKLPKRVSFGKHFVYHFYRSKDVKHYSFHFCSNQKIRFCSI